MSTKKFEDTGVVGARIKVVANDGYLNATSIRGVTRRWRTEIGGVASHVEAAIAADVRMDASLERKTGIIGARIVVITVDLLVHASGGIVAAIESAKVIIIATYYFASKQEGMRKSIAIGYYCTGIQRQGCKYHSCMPYYRRSSQKGSSIPWCCCRDPKCNHYYHCS